MKQFSFEVTSLAELQDSLPAVREYLDAHKVSSVLTHVYSGYSERTRINAIVSSLEEFLPESSIVGATSGGEMCEGRVAEPSIVVVISLFENTIVTVSKYKVHAGDEEHYGKVIQGAIDETPAIKAAELLVDCQDFSTATMFPFINKCSPRVQIFGAVPYAHDVKKPMFVFANGATEDTTVLLITYAGEDFYVTTDYVIGWKPMGIAMTVTKAAGSVLNELDGRSAFGVYDKYLKIPNDEHFFEEALEFPFLRYSNGIYMMRLPYAGLPDGSIELRAPIKEGDVVYLSYGDVSTILSEVYEARGRMERFYPQYIRMLSCATRKTFWGSEINKETEAFQSLADTAGFFTGGEILRVNDELVHFNATLVIVGMREGMPDQEALLRMDERRGIVDPYAMQTSMVRRMANYINVAMQELQDAMRSLQVCEATVEAVTENLASDEGDAENDTEK